MRFEVLANEELTMGAYIISAIIAVLFLIFKALRYAGFSALKHKLLVISLQ